MDINAVLSKLKEFEEQGLITRIPGQAGAWKAKRGYEVKMKVLNRDRKERVKIVTEIHDEAASKSFRCTVSYYCKEHRHYGFVAFSNILDLWHGTNVQLSA